MDNFEQSIKTIEKEVLALKTASQYTSVRSVNYSSATLVYTGLYRINYGGDDEPVFSFLYVGTDSGHKGLAYARTPSGNTQVVEINSYYFDYGTAEIKTGNVPLVIVSNKPIISITRI